MVKKNFLKSSLIIAIAVAMMLPVIPTMSFAATSDKPVFTYSAHVQTYGWKSTVFSSDELELEGNPSKFAGTSGESKRVEGLKIQFKTSSDVKVSYRAHVQGIGWQDWQTAKSEQTIFIGTEGQSKRVEAIQMSVEGLEGYRVLYRAHVQGIGWQDWVDAATDAYAGTEGQSKRVEGLEIAVISTASVKYDNNHNGTHTISYNGKQLKTVDCSFGDWVAADSSSEKAISRTKTCTLCNYVKTETKTLEEALKADTVVTVKNLKLTNNTTIPEGTMLVVEGKLETNSKAITNEGAIVAKKIDSASYITNEEGATVTIKGKYIKGDKDVTSPEKVLKDALDQTSITNIEIEEGSIAQDVETEVTLNHDVTADLGGTTVNIKVNSKNPMIIHKSGNLTLKNAIIKDDTKTATQLTSVIRSQATEGNITISDCAFTTSKGDGLEVGYNGTSGQPGQDISDLSKVSVTISNSKFTINDAEGAGLFVKGNGAKVSLNNVDITANGKDAACIFTNNYSKDIKMNVVGGHFQSTNGIVALLANVGTYTFDGSTLLGKDAIEIEGGELNVINNSSVIATNAKQTQYKSNGSTGNSTTGCGIQLILTKRYNSNVAKTTNITIKDSTVKGTNNYGVLVLEDSEQSLDSKANVNLNYYAGSTIAGALGRDNIQLIDSSKVTVKTNNI